MIIYGFSALRGLGWFRDLGFWDRFIPFVELPRDSGALSPSWRGPQEGPFSGGFGIFRDFRVFLSGSGFREHAGVLGLQGSKVRVVGLL